MCVEYDGSGGFGSFLHNTPLTVRVAASKYPCCLAIFGSICSAFVLFLRVLGLIPLIPVRQSLIGAAGTRPPGQVRCGIIIVNENCFCF